jgi:hypothetical protein
MPVPAGASWLPALERLARSAAVEGGLHDAGLAAFTAKLTLLAAERLRAERLLAENPGIRERPLPVRFAIAGLGRSGTTLLHRLLCCDPDVEFLPTWQAFRPVPSSIGERGEDPRRRATRDQIDALRRANPDALRIHPLDADAPEEEVFLLQHSFASMLFALSCPLPSYSRWLNATEHRAAYHFAFDLLRLNEAAAGTAPGRPRVMKSPQFLLDLPLLVDLLPETVIAQTFRDPVDLVGSYCSTYANSRRASVATFDPIALGRERVDQLAAMTERALAVRARHGAGRFVDVHYADLVADPISVVERIYAAARLPLGAGTRRAIERWLADNPQGRAGRHDYRLADYGLDRNAIETRFAVFIERFGVRPEAGA